MYVDFLFAAEEKSEIKLLNTKYNGNAYGKYLNKNFEFLYLVNFGNNPTKEN